MFRLVRALMVCVVCVFGGEVSDVIYLLEELRQCKSVSSSWYGVWGKGPEYGVYHTPDFYGVWCKKLFCFRVRVWECGAAKAG